MIIATQLEKNLSEKIIDTDISFKADTVGKVIKYDAETGKAIIKLDDDFELNFEKFSTVSSRALKPEFEPLEKVCEYLRKIRNSEAFTKEEALQSLINAHILDENENFTEPYKELGNYIDTKGKRDLLIYNYQDFLDKTFSEAKDICFENNLEFRVIQMDNNHCMITDDFKPDRLNFVLMNGLITEVSLS